MNAITHKNLVCDLMQHLVATNFRQPDVYNCGDNCCDIVDMMQPIFAWYDPLANWSDNIARFGVDMLTAYRETKPASEEPMIAWLQQVFIMLVEFEINEA
jgi:hypothetical protein